MAWVRIHDGAMTHPKIIGLSDGAFRAWVWGLSYAQAHLTDGRIPDAAVRSFRAAARAQQELVMAGLWETAEGGVCIHDFLEWNDGRSVITERQRNAKRRKAEWLAKNSVRNTPEEHTQNVNGTRSAQHP